MKDQEKMCIGKNLGLLALAAVLISFSTGSAYAITIKGNIINMDEAKVYTAADSYLQLVAIPAGGGIKVKASGGRYTYESDLPQTKMPKTGTFSISAPELKPGRYIIVGQKLEGFDRSMGGGHFLVRKSERKTLEIEVKAGEDKSTIDIGEVYIPVPNSKHF